SRIPIKRLWHWLVAGRTGSGFHSAPARLRVAGGHWGCGFQHHSILLWPVALGLVVAGMYIRFRRFYFLLSDPGRGAVAAERAATYPRPGNELLLDQPRYRADRNLARRSPCPLLRRSHRRPYYERERPGFGIAGHQHAA